MRRANEQPRRQHLQLQAEKATQLFEAIKLNTDTVEAVERWVVEIREERADPTGAARLRHIWERQRREEAAAGTLGKSVYAQELAKTFRIYPDDQGDPK